MRRPNLFLIGAMKSGTSSLHDLLGQHPDIFMCKRKEPMYFSREEKLKKGERNYLELFKSARDERYVGESSTEYSKLPYRIGVAERIFNFNPEAQIIYLMRDPVRRAISHYWHQVGMGRENRPMKDAIHQDSDYVMLSNYCMQLEPYMKLFGEKRVLCLLTEEMSYNAKEFLRSLWVSLDIQSDVNVRHRLPKNTKPKRIFIMPHNIITKKILQRYPYLSNALRVKGIWFQEKQNINNIGTVKFYEFMQRNSDNVEDKLRDILYPSIVRLKELTGLKVERWLT